MLDRLLEISSRSLAGRQQFIETFVDALGLMPSGVWRYRFT